MLSTTGAPDGGGTPPPTKPVLPPWTTIATSRAAARRTTSATSAVLPGRTTISACPWNRPVQSVSNGARRSGSTSTWVAPTTAASSRARSAIEPSLPTDPAPSMCGRAPDREGNACPPRPTQPPAQRRTTRRRVAISVADGVADVRLNRPDKLNALDQAMFDALVSTGELIRQDPSVRAVVLSGEGRGFCSGLDFASFQAMAGAGRGGRGDGPPGPPAAGPHHQPRPAGRVRVDRTARARHRSHPRGGTGRRPADRAGRRFAVRGPRCSPVRAGNQVGIDPRHDGHPHVAAPGAASTWPRN